MGTLDPTKSSASGLRSHYGGVLRRCACHRPPSLGRIRIATMRQQPIERLISQWISTRARRPRSRKLADGHILSARGGREPPGARESSDGPLESAAVDIRDLSQVIACPRGLLPAAAVPPSQIADAKPKLKQCSGRSPATTKTTRATGSPNSRADMTSTYDIVPRSRSGHGCKAQGDTLDDSAGPSSVHFATEPSSPPTCALREQVQNGMSTAFLLVSVDLTASAAAPGAESTSTRGAFSFLWQVSRRCNTNSSEERSRRSHPRWTTRYG